MTGGQRAPGDGGCNLVEWGWGVGGDGEKAGLCSFDMIVHVQRNRDGINRGNFTAKNLPFTFQME